MQPHMDHATGEMMMFHSTFFRPFVRYTVLPSSQGSRTGHYHLPLLGKPVPGVSSPRIMHDFGVSRHHTIIINMPLSLNPLHLLLNRPVVSFDRNKQTRFGVFPRHEPGNVQWFATEACCIFHTVNAWDETFEKAEMVYSTVNLLSCRMTSPLIIFAAGNIATTNTEISSIEQQCRLYFHQFNITGGRL